MSSGTVVCASGVALIGAGTAYVVSVVEAVAAPDLVRFVFSGVAMVAGVVLIELGTCLKQK